MNKSVRVLLATVGISVFIFTIGCSSIGQKSPSQVVVAVYMAANEAKYSEVKKYLSSELINNLRAPGSSMKELCDYMTSNGTIQKIEILKEEVRGEGAKVYFRIHFKDGKTTDVIEIPLIKEGGQWKLSIG